MYFFRKPFEALAGFVVCFLPPGAPQASPSWYLDGIRQGWGRGQSCFKVDPEAVGLPTEFGTRMSICLHVWVPVAKLLYFKNLGTYNSSLF